MDNLTATAPPESSRVEAESRSAGAVGSAVYGAYLRAAGHPLIVLLMLLVATLAQLLGSASDWWTGYWSVPHVTKHYVDGYRFHETKTIYRDGLRTIISLSHKVLSHVGLKASHSTCMRVACCVILMPFANLGTGI